MNDVFEAIIFYDELSPEERATLRQKVADNPEYARAYREWSAVRHAVRTRLEDSLPDRSLLVLYALDEAGIGDSLSADERQALDAGRDTIQNALNAVPALAHVVERIQDEHADFESAWASHNGAMAAASESSSTTRDPSEVSQKAARMDRQPRRSESQSRTTTNWPKRLAIAVVALGFAIVTLLLIQGDPVRTQVEVADGEVRVVELPDGSTVRMIGEGLLEYTDAESAEDFNRRARLVAGNAVFDVTSSPRPFLVETPTSETRVLGTLFTLETTELATEIVLIEGEVEFRAPGAIDAQGYVLEPGQASSVKEGEPPLPPRTVILADELAWTGLLFFRESTIADIVARLADEYDTTIEVDPVLSGELVTGTFERDQPIDQVLNTVAATLNARVEGSTAEGFTLVPESAEE